MASFRSNSNNSDCMVGVNSNEDQLLQTSRNFVTAFSNLRKSNHELLEFIDGFYVKTLKTHQLCAAIEEQHLHLHRHSVNPKGAGLTIQGFFHDLARAYRQQLLVREALQTLRNSSDQDLARLGYVKKASAAFFTAAAAACAAAAAAKASLKRPAAAVAVAMAVASIALSAGGSWADSLLKKRESGVKKQREIINVMTMGAKIITKDLSEIHAVARRLQYETELVVDSAAGKKMEAVTKTMEELRGLAEDYSRDMSWARAVVLESITKYMD